MRTQQKTSDADLLQLPDIDGLVRDIKGQETVSTATEEVEEPVIGDSWTLFLDCSQQYDYRTRKGDRKRYVFLTGRYRLQNPVPL